jgi:hypothetical protein
MGSELRLPGLVVPLTKANSRRTIRFGKEPARHANCPGLSRKGCVVGVELLIGDGAPYWYLSTEIWAVPGDDPSGPPGSPVAGQPSYLWARVENTGDLDVNGVRVDFYWANPATQVTRTNATLVGSAFGDVAAGTSQEVLCLIPWIPVIVNGGHECLVAVANHASDPLPSPLPDAFDPPTYRQVAQRNLTVLAAGTKGMLALTIGGTPRADKDVRLVTEVGGELDRQTLMGLGIADLRPADERVVEVGLHREAGCLTADEPIGEAELRVRVPRRSSAAAYIAVRAGKLRADQYQLVRVVELDGQDVLGGLGLVVTGAKEGGQ